MLELALLALAGLAQDPPTPLPFWCETQAISAAAGVGTTAIAGELTDHEGLVTLTVGPEAESVYTTVGQHGRQPFRELLVSWNVDVPPACAFVVELSVVPQGESTFSEWMHLGEWGDVPSAPRLVTCAGGKVDVDFFVGERLFDAAKVRVRATSREAAQELRIRGLTLCFSDRESPAPRIAAPAKRSWGKALDVPFRSQKVEKPDIASRICSPTSLSMVLAFRGVDRPTADVCQRAYDAANDMYGNWPRNVQAAYSLGVPGYLTRYSDWTAVETEIRDGQPLILSIAAKKGQLTGAPYSQTAGHLLVLRGFDEHGNCLVNDPAATDAEHGQVTYARAELEEVWMRRGGVCYVLLNR